MNIKNSFCTMFRLLFFKMSKEDLLSLNQSDLTLGLFFTWIVGIGHYWDDPGAKLLQHIGIGSVAYIFTLAFFIWILLKPFHIANWSYKNILTFISLTSTPALLYAIPVERFLSIDTSAAINAYFLLAVAIWRVALLIFYLRRFADLSIFETAVSSLLPLTAIVSSLSFLNLERAVFNIMGGIREKTSNDAAYAILNLLTMMSLLLLLPMLLSYLIISYKRYKKKSNAQRT